MMHRALLIDDKQDVVDHVGEILEHSLQHEYHVARSNEDARKLLGANEYTYILLDLEIPASPDSERPRIQNGVSLFRQILEIKGVGVVPIIIMTSHTKHALNLTSDFQNDGLTFGLSKSLWTQAGRTVEDVVRKALDAVEKRKQSGTQPDAKPRPRASIRNDPITLDKFMAKFCEKKKGTFLVGRRKALLAANWNGSVKLPDHVEPWSSGQAKKYLTHDLLDAWHGYVARKLVPPLRAQYRKEVP